MEANPTPCTIGGNLGEMGGEGGEEARERDSR